MRNVIPGKANVLARVTYFLAYFRLVVLVFVKRVFLYG